MTIRDVRPTDDFYRDVDQALTLSVRTVESHVRNALTKLGLTSRTQIAVWLHERRD